MERLAWGTPVGRGLLVAAALSATLWAYACGDGATEPPATAQLAALGATVQLSAEVRDQNGQVMSGATVAGSSSDALVVTVDGSGLVTAWNRPAHAARCRWRTPDRRTDGRW